MYQSSAMYICILTCFVLHKTQLFICLTWSLTVESRTFWKELSKSGLVFFLRWKLKGFDLEKDLKMAELHVKFKQKKKSFKNLLELISLVVMIDSEITLLKVIVFVGGNAHIQYKDGSISKVYESPFLKKQNISIICWFWPVL